MNAKYKEGEAQHQLILLEAERQGISTLDVSDKFGRLATLLKSVKNEELLIQGIPESWINSHASRVCNDKHLTKELFKKLNIPSPNSSVFTDPAELESGGLFDGQQQFVCKPAIGTNGVGVVFGISSIEDVRTYYSKHIHLGTTFLLEELHPGYDLRIQTIDGHIVAACKRLPAHVTGDGQNTLQSLIDFRKKEIRLQNPANDLIVDNETISLFKDQKVSLNSVIPAGGKVRLKRISNMAQGGHAVDVTSELATVYSDWVKDIAQNLNTGYFALDVMCNDHTSNVAGVAEALEINLRAEWMHHTFSEVRTHDLAKTVVDALFNQ